MNILAIKKLIYICKHSIYPFGFVFFLEFQHAAVEFSVFNFLSFDRMMADCDLIGDRFIQWIELKRLHAINGIRFG